jgi:hypothetical protein
MSYFHYGLAESVKPNGMTSRGIPTSHELDPAHPLVIPYIMGVALLPSGFDRVMSIVPSLSEGGVNLIARNRESVHVPLDVGFLKI